MTFATCCVFRDVDHRNVLKLLGQSVDTAPYLTVLELSPFVSCLQILATVVVTPFSQRFCYLNSRGV